MKYNIQFFSIYYKALKNVKMSPKTSVRLFFGNYHHIHYIQIEIKYLDQEPIVGSYNFNKLCYCHVQEIINHMR